MAVRADDLHDPRPHELGHSGRQLAAVPHRPLDPDPAGTGRDPSFLLKARGLLELYVKWFRPEVRGWESLPESGPMLLVGNHSGGATPPDLPILFTAWWKERGLDEPLYALFHSFFLKMPGVRGPMERSGAIEAAPDDARAALRAGGSVVVYPGGDWDAFRPWTDRYKVDFAGRTGFVRLALETGVPIVPVVTCGVQDSIFVLTRGEKLARFLPWLKPMRVKVNPILIGAPWGISVGLPTIPLPARTTVQLGPPIDLGHGPEAADDEGIVRACYDKVLGQMQATMDALAAARAKT